MRRVLLVLLLALGLAPPAYAQGGAATVQAIDPTTGATVSRVGDTSNKALRTSLWFLNTNIDPRDISDRIGRQIGRLVLINSSNVEIGTSGSPLFVSPGAGASFAVTGTFWQATQPVSGTFWPTTAASPSAARLSDGAAFYKATTPSDTQPISAASLPLPSGAATEAGNLATIAAKDFATQTTLALIKAKTDNLDVASSTLATAANQTTGNSSLASIKTNTDPLVASGAGGYVRQDATATIAKESGGNLATIAGAVTASVVQENVKEVNGVTTLTGAGATGTGAQRVTVAQDSTTVAGSASLPAGSNVIGHVIADSGSTTAVTGNVTAVQATGTNLHAVIDSGSTTAVTQATGTNLHTVVDSGTITTVSAVTAITNALPAGSNVIGHVIADSGSTTAATQATAANLNAQVQGAGASGASKSGNPVQVGAVFNTTQPTVTSGQTVEAQATARGAQIVATGTDTFNTTINAALPAGSNVIGHVINDSGSTTAVTGNVTVVQPTGTNLHAVLDTTSTTAATQATAANLNAQVQGAGASGASKAGNPVQVGGVFNTTQPTVTNGQGVEAQMTARGAQIVATGTDTLNVTVNAALPAGSAVIGHVINDSGSTTAVTGNVTVVQPTGTNLHAVLDTTSTTAVTQATGTNLHAVIDSGSTTAATQATASNLNAQVQGAAASGATKSGNPVQMGGVFNTTQPTVTNGQAVESQLTARGSQIVATGVEGFTVTANAGTNLNTSALALSATQTDRTQKTQISDGTRDGTVKAASTAAAALDTSVVVALSPNSPLPAGTAVIGHTINDSGSTTAVTGNVTVVQGTGTNLHAVLDATSTTAVTQATGTNLHTVVDSGTITAVTAITNALPSGSNVIGHVIADTGSTTAVTGNVTAVQATGTNLHTVLDSGTLSTITNAVPVGNVATIAGVAPSFTGTAQNVTVTGNTTFLDTGTFTPATTGVSPAGYVVDDLATGAVSEGQAGAARMSTSRVAYANVRDSTGAYAQSVGSDGAALVNCTNCPPSVTVQTRGSLQRSPLLGLRLYGALGQPLGDATPMRTTVANIDPCVDLTKAASVAVSQTSNTQIVAGVPGKRILICRYGVVGADAESVSLVEGSGSTCGTSTAAVIGATTAASGMAFSANGGITEGAGSTWIAITKVAGDSLCVFQSGSGVVAGSLKYAIDQ